MAVAVAAAAATMVGGELGILCFFESLLQEQCRFLWVSPSPALRQPRCPGCPVLPPSDPLLEKWGGDLGGSWSLEGMALLDEHHHHRLEVAPLWPQFPHLHTRVVMCPPLRVLGSGHR